MGSETRRCDWCSASIEHKRSVARTCSKRCRQALHRFRVAPAAETDGRPIRVAFADPPYPGCAARCYGDAEVDHRRLVDELVGEYPDGWALATSSEASRAVWRMCPDGTTLNPWVHGFRGGPSMKPHDTWEALLVFGGRQRRHAEAHDVRNALVWNGRHRSHPGALMGMKPAAYCEWMFRLLNLCVGDTLVDLFPGSGSVMRAWAMFQSGGSPTGLPSRLAEANANVDASSC